MWTISNWKQRESKRGGLRTGLHKNMPMLIMRHIDAKAIRNVYLEVTCALTAVLRQNLMQFCQLLPLTLTAVIEHPSE